MKRTDSAYLKYLLSLLLFGANGLVVSYISMSSYEIVLGRTLIGSLLLLAIFILSGRKFTFWQNKQDFAYLLISGIAMGASWLFLFAGYRLSGVAIATLIYYFGPAIIMVSSPLFFAERLGKRALAGFAIVLLGEFLVNSQSISAAASSLGLLYGGLSALMYAVMVISNKKVKKITGLENASLQLLIAFCTALVFVAVKQGLVIEIAKSDWLPLLILGLVNTGLGCYLYFSSIGHLPAQTVAILGYLDPFSALVFAAAFLGENLSFGQAIGALCIIGGAIFGEYSRKKKQI